MSGIFYTLGRRLAPHILKAKWLGASLTGDSSEKLRAEHAMGTHLANDFAARFSVVAGGDQVESLGRIAARLAARLRNRELRFRVRPVAYPDVNALAFPGGFIFVSLSLIELCGGDEDELAFGIAHEMGHVVLGHAARRFLTESMLRVLASRAGRGSGQPLASLLSKLLQQSYSRNQELEADRFAASLAASAGYDPSAGVTFFERIGRSGASPTGLGAYFSSHPPFAERVQALRATCAKLPVRVKAAS